MITIPGVPPPSITAISIIPAATSAATTTTTSPTSAISQNTSDAQLATTFIIIPSTSGYVDSVPTCPHCDPTFTSRIGLVGHLRIRRIEVGDSIVRPSISTMFTVSSTAERGHGR
ncbi:hypothetical protein SprV_0301238600 [Sparganum proliferum]